MFTRFSELNRRAGRYVTVSVMSIGALSLAASPAVAQGTSRAGAKPFAGQVIARVVYDSNVSRGSQAVATARTLRQDDILYSPSARIDLNLPFAGQNFFLNGTVGYEFYQYNKMLQRERVDLLAGAAGQLGPCGTTATVSYSRRQSDLADLLLTVTTNVQDQLTLAAQASCAVAPGLSGNLGVQSGKTTSSAPGSGVVDSNLKSVNAGVSYQNATLGSIGILASYSKNDYAQLPGSPVANSTGFSSYSAGLTYGRPIGNRLQGQVSVFYSDTQSSGSNPETFTGLTGSGALTYRASSRLQSSLSYGRTISSTIQQGSSYSVTENVQLDGRYSLSSRLKTGIGASWSRRSYRGGAAALQSSRIANEERQALFGSLSLQVGRNASLATDIRYEVRNTNLTIFDYKAVRVGLTATQSF